MDIIFNGENLLPGQIGHLLMILAFTGSAVSLTGYFLSIIKKDALTNRSWLRLADIAFLIQGLSIIGVVSLLYFLIFSHAFEYDYIRRHSSETLPTEYLVSSFWAGQQGSFLLWLFWNTVLGGILLTITRHPWKAPVMATFSLLQIILTSMLLGIFIPRGISWIVLYMALNLPLWFLFNKQGLKGWKSFIPLYNLWELFRNKEKTKGWLPYALALPVNLILIGLLIKGTGTFEYLTESIRLGASPFALARAEFAGNSIFLFSDYLQRIEGVGLNPLLQNYWMVIHPPTLFLGFASTIIPFAFAMSGLVSGKFKEWIQPALPWTLFSTMILGLGVLMGGMWAYESLSFGGFWAWDPVENASLVPWLTLIAGLHTMLIAKHSGHALRATYILFSLTAFFILYSTFLTRSGILGDSSVHSFTDLGMMGQLIILIIAIMIPGIILMIANWKQIPSPKQEERFSSREFWMFVGSLILLISAFHIIFSTSLPVFNKIAAGINGLIPFFSLKSNAALPENVVGFYNNVQVWIAIVLALLTACVQFFKYKSSSFRKIVRQLFPILILSLVFTAALEIFYQFETVGYMFLVFAGIFTIGGNLLYFISVIKGRIKVSGASVAHFGFGLLLLGIVIAFSESRVISKNYMSVNYGESFDDDFKQNNLYMLKGKSYFMGDYIVSFSNKIVDGQDLYYQIDYRKINDKSGKVEESFLLKPHLMIHPDMDLIANPSTKKYFDKDIFTHINSIPMTPDKKPLELPDVDVHKIGVNDSFFTTRGMVTFEGVKSLDDGNSEISAVITLKLDDLVNEPVYAEPGFVIQDNQFLTFPAEMVDYGLKFEIEGLDPQEGIFTIRVTDNNDWLILKAVIFPWINLVWLGIAIIMAGFIIAMFNRSKQYGRIKHRPV